MADKICDKCGAINGEGVASQLGNESELIKLLNGLAERMKVDIKDCKKFGEDLDNCSWNCEEGVLLTANEAQLLIDNLKSI